jgi:hypothetical protein
VHNQYRIRKDIMFDNRVIRTVQKIDVRTGVNQEDWNEKPEGQG